MAPAIGTALTDALFGTRAHTQGAQYQLPRKIPLRIEPKTYFANERTFLSWLSMATTLGTVGTAIAGLAEDGSGGKHRGAISMATVSLITTLLLPISILMIGYALFTYYYRSEYIRKKQVGFFDDRTGPVVLCLVVIASLFIIFVAAVKDMATRGAP